MKAKVEKKCRCRKPKRHRDCMYCGSGYIGEYVCGVCREAGIDGRVIRGTERRMCKKHKAEYLARVERERGDYGPDDIGLVAPTDGQL
jgi:hypothetical protein